MIRVSHQFVCFMSWLLGVEYLPILMPHTRTAYLYMNMAHRVSLV